MSELRGHWDRAYESTAVEASGWYEAVPEVSLELVERCGLAPGAAIVDIGGGASTLANELLRRGFTNLTVVDISSVALEHLAGRLGPERARHVRLLTADVTAPEFVAAMAPVDLWHDRALLHFLTTEDDRRAYAHAVQSLVRPGGWVIVAAFAVGGATECSGLPVRNYDEQMLAAELGAQFTLIEARRHIYQQPSGGLRPYVYALFRRGPGSHLPPPPVAV